MTTMQATPAAWVTALVFIHFIFAPAFSDFEECTVHVGLEELFGLHKMRHRAASSQTFQFANVPR